MKSSTRTPPPSARRRPPDFDFNRERAFFLALHQFDQCFIARHEIDERAVLKNGGRFHGLQVPRATEVLHRNGNPKDSDKRFWMAVSKDSLEWLRRNQDAAHTLGFLVNGSGGLTTADFMKKKGRRA